MRRLLVIFTFLLTAYVFACVPISQQITSSQEAEITGFIGPLVVDKQEFERVVGYYHYLVGPYSGQSLPMSNCGCFSKARVIQEKLIVSHHYGGGESNRESAKLHWTGKYHRNAKGEYIVDVILHSDKSDIRRAMVHDTKIIDIEQIKRTDVSSVWINLVGYETLIKYHY